MFTWLAYYLAAILLLVGGLVALALLAVGLLVRMPKWLRVSLVIVGCVGLVLASYFGWELWRDPPNVMNQP